MRKMNDQEGAWACLCGNSTEGHGFYPCNRFGELVDPRKEAWELPLFVCLRCGRIILNSPPVIVGMRHDSSSSARAEVEEPSKEVDRAAV